MSTESVRWWLKHAPGQYRGAIYWLGYRLSDVADDGSSNIYPRTVAELARDLRLSSRQVQRALSRLQSDGVLIADERTGGRGRMSRWRLARDPDASLKGDKMSPISLVKGDIRDAERVTSRRDDATPCRASIFPSAPQISEGAQKRKEPEPESEASRQNVARMAGELARRLGSSRRIGGDVASGVPPVADSNQTTYRNGNGAGSTRNGDRD